MPTDICVTNQQFLQALYGEDALWVHVTDFTHDPSNIPNREHLIAWKGNYFSRYAFKPRSNQYFTISLFYADDQGVARRRKALFRSTPVIVLDDVKEKLSMTEVEKLPAPSWILETSPGSEQWGYILNTPCTDRHRVENLLDGLVANGLAPNGRDPGMKGVTRYVRLPEGVNSKQAKMINGQPWQCRMTLWEPFRTTTIEQLAEPFAVDLDALRREARVDGAAAVDDHPLLDLHDIIRIKEVRSDGRYDITCPWVHEHTGEDDSGTAIFTNADGTLGFKCHHGSCQGRTGKDLLNIIEDDHPGFGAKLTHWQATRAFSQITQSQGDSQVRATSNASTSNGISFLHDGSGQERRDVSTPPIKPTSTSEPETLSYQSLIDLLRKATPFSDEARQMATQVLKSVDSLAAIDKLHLHEQVRDIMRWSKPEFKQILDDLRRAWYSENKADISFFDEVVFIAEQNQFFDIKKRIFFTPEAYQNAYAHLDSEARKEALQGGRVTKVDRIDYAPKKPPVFVEDGVTYGNSWFAGTEINGVQGDVTRWLDHFNILGWGKERDHMLKWMAFTIRHPDIKINHMLILGSGEGCGKDFLLYPFMKAMGHNHKTIEGEELLSQFDDYKMSCKHLHINEVELGDHNDAKRVGNKLKPLASAPPMKLSVNQKSVKRIEVRNILNLTMTTNSQRPVHLNGVSRRIFAVWSTLNMRDEYDEMLPEWINYWTDRWNWIYNGGAEACIWYLRNVVDLSDFNPGVAPPMTDFLRSIAESSKSPLQQTLEAFMREKIDVFKCDIISSVQMEKCIKTSVFADGLVYVNTRFVSPVRIDEVLKTMPNNREVRSKSGRLWVIRNHMNYSAMTDEQIFQEHLRQHQQHKSTSTLTAVN